MRNFRLLAAGASALALLVSACSTGGASPTTAPAPPTTAAAKPTTAAAASPSAAAAASPSAAAAASPKPAVSPAPSPSAAASPVAAAGGPKPTVKVGSFGFDESEVLQELYAGVLEANGYTIERHPRLGSREIVEPALTSGQIDLVGEYLATDEAFEAGKVTPPATSKASSDPAATQASLQALLTPKQLSVLDYAANAVDTNGFVVTKANADKYKLAKMSDLQPVAGQLVLGGPPECPQRPFCLIGLQNTYKLQFKDFKPLDSGGPLTVTALDSGDIDLGLLFTTDPNITLKNYVLLADDMKLQLADNIAPVVRTQLLTSAPDSKTLLNSVTAKLSTADLTDMNKQVGIDHKDAKTVAVAYLKAQGIIK